MSAMTPSHASRTVLAIVPQSSSGAVTGLGIKVKGWRWAKVNLLLGAMAANATSDVTIEESDTLGGSYTAVTGAVFAQKIAATHASKAFSGLIDCSKRKAYIRVVATQATAASLVCVEVELSLPDRTERCFVAQESSASPAAPLTETDIAFSV